VVQEPRRINSRLLTAYATPDTVAVVFRAVCSSTFPPIPSAPANDDRSVRSTNPRMCRRHHTAVYTSNTIRRVRLSECPQFCPRLNLAICCPLPGRSEARHGGRQPSTPLPCFPSPHPRRARALRPAPKRGGFGWAFYPEAYGARLAQGTTWIHDCAAL
jgi:hypothetical protein